MPISIMKPKILAGQSLSDSVNTASGNPIFFIAPVDWTPANVSFQFSCDGTVFGDLFFEGKEFIMPLNRGSANLLLGDIFGSKGIYFKLRSGSRDYPVAQTADREFQFAILS